MSNIKYDPECIRKRSNWSSPDDKYKFDAENFDPKALLADIETRSPKLKALLANIKRLDKRDMQKDGVMYKHFIFSDLKSGGYGAKLLAAALLASGYNLGYEAPRLSEVKKVMGEAAAELSMEPSPEPEPVSPGAPSPEPVSPGAPSPVTTFLSNAVESIGNLFSPSPKPSETEQPVQEEEEEEEEEVPEAEESPLSEEEEEEEEVPEAEESPLSEEEEEVPEAEESVEPEEEEEVPEQEESVEPEEAEESPEPEPEQEEEEEEVSGQEESPESEEEQEVSEPEESEGEEESVEQEKTTGGSRRKKLQTFGDDEEDDNEGSGNKKNKKIWGKMRLHDDAKLKETSSNNFYLLSSVGVYNQPINVTNKKAILKKFNQRPENVQGEEIRFIIMDSGFKEGIDLFDIKYIHIFEPPKTMADQKQVIGRGTRTCGQKGLKFNPTKGWPLDVFIYNVTIPESIRDAFLGSATVFDMYLKSLNIDLRLFEFSQDLEQTTIFGSVDYELNRNIHTFAIEKGSRSVSLEKSPEEEESPIVSPPEGYEPASPESTVYSTISSEGSQGGSSRAARMNLGNSPDMILTGRLNKPATKTATKKKRFVINKSLSPINLDDSALGWPASPSPGNNKFDSMRRHVHEHFSDFKWGKVKLENLCEDKPTVGGAPSKVIDLSPTQNFLKHYFTPQNPTKGMLTWHSVGTGKTCSAIATASSTFERSGYTILWVTRTTLKSDIWKNMFDQVCSERIANMISETKGIPEEHAKRMRLLSKSWKIRPMSYKQFSNLVSKQNSMYKTLVKINGSEDPLRKTLLIIDEAHKLYGGDDLSSIERPDMGALHQALMNSYRISGRDSVRLLLMTATPITNSPMELIKLVNLCKPVFEQIPNEFESFAQEYLDANGRFTDRGRVQYLNDIAGHISYLNREGDARQFSQPNVKMVNVPMVRSVATVNSFDRRYMREIQNSNIATLKKDVETAAKAVDGDLKDLAADRFGFLYDKCNDIENTRTKKACRKMVKRNITLLLAEAKDHVSQIRNSIKEIREKVKDSRLFKTQALQRVMGKIDLNPAKYNKFKESAYYNIKYKCGKKITVPSELDQSIENDPDILRLDGQIAATDMEIQMLHANLKTEMAAFQARVKRMREALKEKMTVQERAEIRLNIKALQASTRKELANRKRDIGQIVNRYTKNRKEIEGKKKKLMRTKKRQLMGEIREQNKQDRKVQAEIARAEKNLRKTRRKEGIFDEEIKNDLVKGLVEKYRAQIDADYQDLESEIQRNIELDREKHAAKERLKAEKAEAKQAAQAQKAAEKTRKQMEKQEMQAARKTQKMREKAEKDMAKEQLKEQRAREKEEKARALADAKMAKLLNPKARVTKGKKPSNIP